MILSLALVFLDVVRPRLGRMQTFSRSMSTIKFSDRVCAGRDFVYLTGGEPCDSVEILKRRMQCLVLLQ